MANDFPAIADLVADALDLAPHEVSNLKNRAPFFMALPFVPSSNGDTHKYAAETGAPVVGFRAENTGRDFDHDTDAIITATLKILDFSFAADKAVADRWRSGGSAAYIARTGRRHLRAAMFAYESQVFQGTNADASGFAGLNENALYDALADEMVIDAGGTTASTGSSCWLIRVDPESVAGVMIEDSPFEIGETIVQNHNPDGGTTNFPIYYTPATTWCGIQVGGTYDIARIANLTADAGKGLTDDLVYSALSLFPNEKPTHAVMSRRSLEQLRASRTATNVTGAPAPTPETVAGLEIITTDGIPNTETLLS